MNELGPKAYSVTEQGEADGWEIIVGFESQPLPDGSSRLVVAIGTQDLSRIHQRLIRVMGERVGILYRRFIDRANPGPNNAPPVDFVGLDVPLGSALSAVSAANDLLYHDSRAELWIRGELGDQLILDRCGLLYCYPDDPGFRDILREEGVPENRVELLLERDFTRHVLHAHCDAQESQMIRDLGLTQIGG